MSSSTQYDEDLTENQFFQNLLNYNTSFQEIVVLLVPQMKNIPEIPAKLYDLKAHTIIQKTEDHLENLNGQPVHITENEVKINTIDIPILFKETHYGQDWEKVKVFCIQRPVSSLLDEDSTKSSIHEDQVKIGNLDLQPLDIKDAIQLLVENSHDSDKTFLFRKLDELSTDVKETLQSSLQNNTTSTLPNKFHNQNIDLLDLLIKNKFNQTSTKIKQHLKQADKMNQLHSVLMASEVYFYNLSYKNLFGYICAKNYKQEMLLNTKILTILPILKQHGCDEIRSDLKCALQGSKANLTMLSYLTNPGAKLDALAKLMNLASIASKSPVSSDELLPWLIQALGTCQIFTLYAQMDFMANFSLVQPPNQLDQFNLATLEAALEHIKSLQLNNPADGDPGDNFLWSSNHDKLNELFKAIVKNDLNHVKQMLDESLKLKCHPLCDCDTCDKLENLLELKEDSNYFIPLMLASWLGKPLIVEYFLSQAETIRQEMIEALDKQGRTALHLSGLNGHQNALLLLLNAKSNPNARDAQGNSVLHFSAGFGHESCTKALLYNTEHQNISLQVSSQNFKGDTSLHLAAKHGFLCIVKLLLEYGASKVTKNNHGEIPMDLAQNIEIKLLLS